MAIKVQRVTSILNLPPNEPKEPPPTPVAKKPIEMREVNGMFQETHPKEEKPLTPYQKYVRRSEEIQRGKVKLDLSKGGTGALGLVSRTAQVYQENAVEPLASRFTIGVQTAIPGEQEIEGKFRRGMKPVEAYRSSKLPFGVKGAIELATDPANLALFGAGKVLKAGQAIPTGALAREGIESGVKQAGKETSPAVQKLTSLIRQAEPYRDATELMRTAELGQKVGVARGIAKEGPAEGAFARSRVALKGKEITADFEPIKPFFSDVERESLYSINRDKWLNTPKYFNGNNTEEALSKLLMGELPTESELKLLEETFGVELADAIMKHTTTRGQRAWKEVVSALNVPRSLVASVDLSAPLRQGMMFMPSHPKEWLGGLAPMVKAFAKEDVAQGIDDALRARPMALKAEDAGLYMAPLNKATAKLGELEEAFATKWADKIPLVRNSNRAYITFLNKLRADTFDTILNGWERSGKTIYKRDRESLADYINKATGRGSFKHADDIAPVASAVFFSPRLVLSRVQAPWKLVTGRPEVRKIVFQDMVKFVGSGSIGLGLLSMIPGVDVDIDPRSSEFGKVRIGPTRYDFWGGEQQLARFVTQMATGSRKAISTGEVYDASRVDIGEQFFRSKLAPVPSVLYDIGKGTTFTGQPTEEAGLTGEAARTITPILIQDMYEAVKEQGLVGGVSFLPSALGAGVSSFYPTGDTFSDEERKKLISEIPEKGVNIKREEALRQASAKERREFREANPPSAQALDERKMKESSGVGRQLLEIKQMRFTQEASLEQEVTNRQIGLPAFAERYREVQAQSAIRADEANRAAKLYTNERPDDPLKRAVFDYYDAYKKAQIAGSLDFELLESRMADLERQWSPEQRQYVADNTQQTEHQGAWGREYEKDKDIIKQAGYWDAHLEIPEVLQHPLLAEQYDLYRGQFKNDPKAFELKYGERRLEQMKDIADMVQEIREAKRAANPELEAALVKWYGIGGAEGDTLQTDLGRKWKQYLSQQLAGK